ncbi:MAG: hypothetical protein Q9160_001460 [Pyrenula sp. 1 TL-2023]
MSAKTLQRFDKLFTNGEKPSLPDRSKPHAVDQGFADEESHALDISTHVEPASSMNQPSRASQNTNTAKGNSQHDTLPQISQAVYVDSSEESDDYGSAFNVRPMPKMKSNMGKMPEGWRTALNAFPALNQSGKPLVGVYCQVEFVAKFPYKYLERDARDAAERVAKHFFNAGKFWESNTWSIYYLNVPGEEYSSRPLMLTPLGEVQGFIDRINEAFKSELFIPVNPYEYFAISFYEDGTPTPRYIGKINSKDSFDDMKDSIEPPPSNYGATPPGAPPAVDRSFAAWRRKVQSAAEANRRKNKALKKKRNNERLLQQQDWHRAMRRAERYLGLRPSARDTEDVDTSRTMSWEESEALRKQQEIDDGKVIPKLIVEKPAPYLFDMEPVIVCVDIESNERNHTQITEIGVSTIDTRDIRRVVPGKGAENWIRNIRSRHFRITENAHITNTAFCAGAPDKFQFGTSEFVNLEHAAEAVDSCFRYPFSAGFEHDGECKPDEHGSTASKDPVLENSTIGNNESPETPTSLTPEETSGPSNDDQATASELAVTRILSNEDPTAESSVRDLAGKIKRTASETASRADTVSDLDEIPSTDTESGGVPLPAHQDTPYENRNIIFLAHDTGSDLTYLRNLGSSIVEPPDSYLLSPTSPSSPSSSTPAAAPPQPPVSTSIHEALDTALLFRVYARETQNRSLAHVLTTLGRTGWYLHCAGNDARYTLESLLALVVAMREKEDRAAHGAEGNTEWEQEKLNRIDEKKREVEEIVRGETGGWDVVFGGAPADGDGDGEAMREPDVFRRSAADVDGGQPPRSWASIVQGIVGVRGTTSAGPGEGGEGPGEGEGGVVRKVETASGKKKLSEGEARRRAEATRRRREWEATTEPVRWEPGVEERW